MKRGKREVKRTGLGRRLLSVFLAVVMCTSMLQLTVFAEGTDAPATSNIMDGAFVLNKDGSVVSNEGANTVNYPTEGFTLTKSVAQPEGYAENEFEVTLQVETSQTVTTSAAAIQLVIDRSTSMDYCSVCGKDMSSAGGNGGGWYPGGWYPGMGGNGDACECEDTVDRMTALKEILTKDGGFLDSLVDADTGAIYVSVVTYSKGAYLVSDWTDITETANRVALKNAINGVSTSGNATNMQAGLMLAYNRLGMDAVKDAGVKYVVMLTDGQANVRSYTSASLNPGSVESIIEAGDASSVNGTDAGETAAKEMATAVENLANTTLYAVGYGTTKEYLVNNIIADGYADNVFAGSNSADVTKAFKNVAQQTVSGMSGAGSSVTDPMGQNIILDVDSVPAGMIKDGNIKWELKPADAEKTYIGNTTKYTYTLKYDITLDTAAPGFEEGKYYPTNGYTYLTVAELDGAELAFNVPGVKGQLPMVDWTVKHYLQDAVGSDTYIEVEADRETGSVKAWTEITATANNYDGYDFSYSDPASLTMTVTPGDDNVIELYYDLETVTVAGTKTWNDNNDQDGVRPTEITINLMANGEKIDEADVSEATDWAYAFNNLPKYDADDIEIEYTITEEAVDGYTANVEGYNVTNTHTPETTTVSGAKTWVDNNNAYNTRPSSITINLLANGVEVNEAVVTANDGWAWSFTGLPKYAGGQLITYTITEDEVANYNTTVNGYNVTNTLSPDSVNISGIKTWNDNNNQDGIRPTSVTINLLADGEEIAEAVVSEATGWAYAFNNLPRYADGVAIVYSITEDEVANYNTTYNGYNVTNTHASATVDITGTKTWNDRNDMDGIRPDSIIINLLANGAKVDSKTVTAADGWAWSFTGLPVYSNGVAIVYSITEDEVAGYTSSVDGYNVTNSHTPAVGTLILNKRGVGAEVPEKTQFTVTGPHNYSKTVTYGEFSEGSYVIANIPVGVYTFTEDLSTAQVEGFTLTAEGNGGTATVTADATARVGITNRYEKIQTTGSLTINKSISGLDTITENTLKNNLSFVVTNEKIGYEKVVPYSESKGAMTLTDLEPGTYTIVEKGADIGGGYDLTVKAYDADDSKDGYQVEVKASKTAATFYITNAYTSRIYNVWFNGGAQGTVKVNDDVVDGVYRNRVFKSEEVAEVKWSAAQLPINVTGHVADHLYQIDNEEVIYQNVGMGPEITEDYGYVMYTFTWADYVNYKNYEDGYVPYTMDADQEPLVYDLAISAPALAVQDGWETNGTFYRNGTQVPFTGIDAAVEYMNSGAVEADNDGVYNVLYVPAYTEEVVPYGNLTINKTATGADVPAGATFTVTDAAGNTVEAKYVDFKDGSYTFKDLPVGTYTVTETNAGVKGYSLKVGGNNQTVEVVANETAVVSITNTYTFNGGGGGGGGGGTIIIPEPPVPLDPQPEPEVEIPEEDVPLVEIPEEEVPLVDVPKTGDASALWMLMSVLSGTGLVGVTFLGRKKKEEE